MKLRVRTPTATVVDADAVHVTIEDGTGSLGIRPGHAPLVTALVPGMVMARDRRGVERYVAVDGGVAVVDGRTVDIVTRRAEPGDDLGRLEETVLARFEQEAADDRANRAGFEKMRIQFLKNMLEFDRAEAG